MTAFASQRISKVSLLIAFCISLLAFPHTLRAEDKEKVTEKTLQIYFEPFEVPLANSSRKINVTVLVEAKGQDKQYRVCQLRARIRDAIITELWNNPIGIVLKEPEEDTSKKRADQKKTKKGPRRDLDIESAEKRLYPKVNRASGKRRTITKVYVLKGKVEPQGEDRTISHRRLNAPVTCGRINFREKGID